MPLKLIGPPGQRNDITQAHDLIEDIDPDALLADKVYDADHLIEKAKQNDSDIVIPSKRNRKIQRPYDEDLYKERNIIERFFNKACPRA